MQLKLGEERARPARLGREAHKLYTPGEGYRLNQSIPGSKGRLRPDAVDFVRGIVRELKPFSKSGIRQGRAQMKKYLNYVNGNFKREGGWKGFVDYY